MKIFRIQHEHTGQGPYFADVFYMGKKFYVHEWIDHSKFNNPEPECDSLLCVNFEKKHGIKKWQPIADRAKEDYIYAFCTERQLKKWFGSKTLAFLIDSVGFDVVVKEIPDDKVIAGYSQCLVETAAWFEAPTVENWLPKQLLTA